MTVETWTSPTFPSSMPTCALRRFPELTTFLSKLGHPNVTITPISFRDKNLERKVIWKITSNQIMFTSQQEEIKKLLHKLQFPNQLSHSRPGICLDWLI
jgi:hypothetical protein